MEDFLRGVSIWALPVLFAVVLHEVAHGWVADRLGDNTARFMGRLTLNPVRHIDPVGTILIPLLLLLFHSPFLFGYARPVPINPRNLRNPRRDMVWVALAGPVTNLLLAVASAILLAIVARLPEFMAWGAVPLANMAVASIIINLVLFIFNLLPIPPLDGGRVAVGLLPGPMAWQLSRLEPYGFFIIVGLLVIDVLPKLLGPFVSGFSKVLISLAIG